MGLKLSLALYLVVKDPHQKTLLTHQLDELIKAFAFEGRNSIKLFPLCQEALKFSLTFLYLSQKAGRILLFFSSFVKRSEALLNFEVLPSKGSSFK